MKTAAPFVFVCMFCGTVVAASQADKLLAQKQGELDGLREQLEQARDSLQLEIATRYGLRQGRVEQRQADKEELDQARERQERAITELARIKEECFAKQQHIADAREALEQKREGWDFVRAALAEMFQKEAAALHETFPLDREQRQAGLESVRRVYAAEGNVSRALRQYLDYRTEWIAPADSLSLSVRTVMPDKGGTRTLQVARFGNVFAYCMDTGSVFYAIRQTGRIGPDRYAVDRVESPRLQQSLAAAFSRWMQTGSPGGTVTVEIMQNEQAASLISGRKTGTAGMLLKWYRAGGPVMVPLVLMTLWGLVLLVIKFTGFSFKHRTGGTFYRDLLARLDKKDAAGALELARSRTGAVAAVARACLEHSQWNRESAEKAVRQILVREVPRLNRHLNTLAVIASAAPLLGLLGTVTGMINLFEVITQYGTGDPKILAGGISEALVTTEAGLMIAIPVVLLHNYLRNRRDDIQAEMETYAISILNRLWPQDGK